MKYLIFLVMTSFSSLAFSEGIAGGNLGGGLAGGQMIGSPVFNLENASVMRKGSLAIGSVGIKINVDLESVYVTVEDVAKIGGIVFKGNDKIYYPESGDQFYVEDLDFVLTNDGDEWNSDDIWQKIEGSAGDHLRNIFKEAMMRVGGEGSGGSGGGG